MRSTPQQWAESGHKLFDRGRFEQAVYCFERAHLPRELQIAKAFQLREEAKSILQPVEQRNAFILAAEAFTQCTEEGIRKLERNRYYRCAAKCYALAGDIHKAVDLYITLEDFASAAREYQKSNCFDDLVRLLKRHEEEIGKWYRDQLFEACVRHYYDSKILRFDPLLSVSCTTMTRIPRPPIPLFPSVEEELNYLEHKCLDGPRILILQSQGRFIEAAEVQLNRGKLIPAIQLFLRDSTNEVAIQRAATLALDNLWEECSFGVPIQTKLQQKGSHAYQVLESVHEMGFEHLSVSDSDGVCSVPSIHREKYLMHTLDPFVPGNTAIHFA